MENKRCCMCGKPIFEEKKICRNCEGVEPSFDVIQIMVILNKITDVSEFVALTTKCQDDVVVKTGRFAVDAKSIMALFSLDLTKPFKVEFYGNIPYEVREGMKKFIVD